MTLYETTYFSQQKSNNLALAPLRGAINARLSDLRQLVQCSGQTPIISSAARKAILAAAGKPATLNDHVYEIPISGHWRIFFAQSRAGLIIIGVGHLDGNTLEEP